MSDQTQKQAAILSQISVREFTQLFCGVPHVTEFQVIRNKPSAIRFYYDSKEPDEEIDCADDGNEDHPVPEEDVDAFVE